MSKAAWTTRRRAFLSAPSLGPGQFLTCDQQSECDPGVQEQRVVVGRGLVRKLVPLK